jgi:hypothetical protein
VNFGRGAGDDVWGVDVKVLLDVRGAPCNAALNKTRMM